ncbi:polysaccharide lyase family 7 protein [Reinekea marinisedimentorum]|uniref:F5/8 type C domain-containing protein n=1 Tax=Reinekea marinisedimentorum TaxID=230495 RepID=A0A4R3I552_9GAMM|nr:polysaccharide lyase family 7 protein [Reinekea marinisedimentorum]TCS41083.1 F5/8 type C domain-containing protein [Reinekea marinisedimentorum]
MKNLLSSRLTAAAAISALSAFSTVMAATPVSVTASEHDGNAPEFMLDGDLSTRWSANGEGQWALFELDKAQTIDAVRVAFSKGNERTSSFELEVSVDGKKWTKVLDKQTSSGSTLDFERYQLAAPVEAKFIRYTGFGNSKSGWNSVTEFQAVNCAVEKCADTDIVHAGMGKTEAAEPVAVSSSEHDGNGPENMLDGDHATRWSSNGDGQWALFEYDKPYSFDAVRMSFHKGDERTSTFSIEASTDGENWTRVLDHAVSSGYTLKFERFDFDAPVDAKFMRIVGHGNSGSAWNSVTEFKAVNCSVNDCPSNEIITAEIIAKIEAEKVLAANSGPASKLSDWKITLPTTYGAFFGQPNEEGNLETAAEILPNGCSVDGSTFGEKTSNEYFNADKNGWHFRVPLEGGATTPNTTYIRTELRELHSWEPCGDTSLANWAYDGGTHTLGATLQINEFPAEPKKKDGVSPDRPKVVLGQIHAHDIDAATAKLLWEGADKPIRVILNKSTKKSAFSVSLGKIADPSKPWVYIIKMTGEGIELSAGGVTKLLKFGQELDHAWKKETFYFKAGLYPQIHPESGGAFDVTYSKISVEHVKRPGDFGEVVPTECNPAVFNCSNKWGVWWPVPFPKTYPPKNPQANLPPGKNFDLSEWYLSVGTDHDANGKPDDVQPQYLISGWEHPEFFHTADDGGLTIKSYIKGVRTSKNTKYVRTELREMLRRGDESIGLQGVTKNNWVFSSAPVEDQKAAGGVDGVLEATLKIDHTTTTGAPEQVGRFIIGQIHANDDEPIRLYYRKLPNHEKGFVYFMHENRNEGSDIKFDLIGEYNGNPQEPEDGIALGEVFSYRIEVVGNEMTVTIMRDGKPDVTQVVDMSESGYDAGGQYMYFKAGVYNQNNSGDPDDYAQVTFYKLETSHGQYQE